MNSLNQDIQIASAIKKLLVAFRNSSLYPKQHDILVTCRKELFIELQSYLGHCRRLVLVAHKNRLLCDGYVLHKGNMSKENLAFLLYRDGIQWIAFESGLEEVELAELLDILKRYRTKEEYDGGDIVTALWQADFTHIKYGADDLLWKDEPILDISSLKLSEKDQSTPVAPDSELINAISLASLNQAKSLWELTEEEKEQTQRFIAEYEQRDTDPDVFDILLIILNEQNDKEDYSAILELVRECFQHTLARGEFRFAIAFLENLSRIYDRYEKDSYWAKPHLDDLYALISSQHLYSGLRAFFDGYKKVTPGQLLELKRVITMLHPQCVLSLGKLLAEVENRTIRHCLLEAMAVQASKNINPLSALIRDENEKVAQPAIGLLSYVKSPRAANILRRLICSGKESNRITAVKALARHPMGEVNDFGGILENGSPRVVLIFLKLVCSERNHDAEKMLLTRLASGKFYKKDIGVLLALYAALGHCGSETSLPLLKRRLFKLNLIPSIVTQTHRVGAAIALFYLKQETARAILERASISIRLSVKKAYRHALERVHGAVSQ